MGWGQARRPKISTKLGNPNPREGSDGDIQIKGTALGAKLWGKWSGRWWDVPLSRDGVTKFGVTDSNYLSIDRDSVDIFTDKVKVASFGSTTTVPNIRLGGRILVDSKNAYGTAAGDYGNICLGITNSILGLHNISIGWEAGKVLEGGESLGHGSNGEYNICIGSSAGESITTGNGNICIGLSTDNSSATGDNAIAIGYGVHAASDNMVIGKAGATSYWSIDFTSSTTWAHSSDLRAKRNIKDDTLGLSFINDLRTKTFQWKSAEEHPEEWEDYTLDTDGNKVYAEINDDIMHGMIAQDVKIALDNAGVDTFSAWSENEKGMQQLAPASFVYPLIKAVQELSVKIDTMQTEINNLKAE